MRALALRTGRRRVDRLRRRHDLSLPRWPADALPSAGRAGLARGLGAAHRRRRLAVGRHVPRRPAAAARRPLRALHHRPRAAEQHHLPDPRGPVAAAVDRLAPGHLPRQQGVARCRRGEPARRRHLRPIGRPARARVHRQLSAGRRDRPRRPAVVRDAQGPRVDRSARRRRGPAAARRDPRRAAARPAPRGAADTQPGPSPGRARAGSPRRCCRFRRVRTGSSSATPGSASPRRSRCASAIASKASRRTGSRPAPSASAHYSYLPPGTLPLPRRRQPRRRPLEQRRGGGAVRGPAARSTRRARSRSPPASARSSSSPAPCASSARAGSAARSSGSSCSARSSAIAIASPATSTTISAPG